MLLKWLRKKKNPDLLKPNKPSGMLNKPITYCNFAIASNGIFPTISPTNKISYESRLKESRIISMGEFAPVSYN